MKGVINKAEPYMKNNDPKPRALVNFQEISACRASKPQQLLSAIRFTESKAGAVCE